MEQTCKEISNQNDVKALFAEFVLVLFQVFYTHVTVKSCQRVQINGHIERQRIYSVVNRNYTAILGATDNQINNPQQSTNAA